MARETKRQMKRHFEELKGSNFAREGTSKVHSYKAQVNVGTQKPAKSSAKLEFEAHSPAGAQSDFAKLGAPGGTQVAYPWP
jgi:hypothetical protein